MATAEDHPDIIAESNIMHDEMLRMTTTTYTKRDKNVRDVDTVNKQLADARIAALGNLDEQPITSENVKNPSSERMPYAYTRTTTQA